MKSIFTILFSAIIYSLSFSQVEVVLDRGHAHNDYKHKRPLFDALELGFRSIEVDVFARNGGLKVAHDPIGLKNKPTIQELYLDPLRDICFDPEKIAYYKLDKSVPLVIMIDFKSAGEKTYEALKKLIEPYKEMLTHYKDGKIVPGYISLLISGNKPYTSVPNEQDRYVTLDCSVDYCSENSAFDYVTRCSNHYKSYFSWNGKNSMPEGELAKLQATVKKVHNQGRKLRFWAAPETHALWETFLNAGVNWMNIDDIKGFQEFYVDYVYRN